MPKPEVKAISKVEYENLKRKDPDSVFELVERGMRKYYLRVNYRPVLSQKGK